MSLIIYAKSMYCFWQNKPDEINYKPDEINYIFRKLFSQLNLSTVRFRIEYEFNGCNWVK